MRAIAWRNSDSVNAILNDTEMLAPGTDGINGLSLSNAMMLSTWTNSTIDLTNLDEDLFYEKLQEQIKNSTIQKDTSASSTAADMSSSF